MKIRVIIVVFCLSLLFSISAYAALEDGLIGAWLFDDGTAKNFAGASNGELQGGVEVADGKVGKGLSFDGVDGIVQIPHEQSMDALANSVSVSAWVYIRQGAHCSAVIFKGERIGWGSYYNYRIITLDEGIGPNNSLSWGVANSGTECWFHTHDAVEPEQWFFMCLTADGSQETAYVAPEGGPVVVPASGQGNPRSAPAPYLTFPDLPIELGVGRAVGGTVGNDAYFDGIIDEVFLWDRALSEDEVSELASGTRPAVAAVSALDKLTTTWGELKK